MLGVQVLIGFDYRAVFEDRFTQLPPTVQHLKIASLSLLLISLALLLAPIPYHRIAMRGADKAVHGFTQKAIEWALLPFALAVSMDVLVAGSHILSPLLAWVTGGAVLVLELLFWFGIEYYKREKPAMNPSMDDEAQDLPLKEKIKQVLIETRIALPGVQATLGFQFIIVLATSFETLPRSLQLVHLASLLCSALCAILLISPAAYHRIVNRGEDSEEFLQFACKMVLTALVPLAFALAGDLAVVVWKVTHSVILAETLSAACLVITLGFWFGYMLWRRSLAGASEIAPHRIETRLDDFQRS